MEVPLCEGILVGLRGGKKLWNISTVIERVIKL